ncbi:MAG: cysteine desulfurase [Tannerellaceae bacterium]|jgi:cysteine desulfurase/selenocysteine lyase|nr:cysteine desulfurase [Tannerellaceae bacterium]
MESERIHFPILSETVNGKPLIYFDNAATTQKPKCVVDKIIDGYYRQNANIHRGVHFLSRAATEAHEDARRQVQQFINAGSACEIIFTRGTTEAINLLASTYTDAFFHDEAEVIISVMEHHSNIVPWQLQSERKRIKLRAVPVTAAGELDMAAYRSLFSERTRLVSLAHVSNVMGTVNNVREIIEIAHAHNVPVLLDGAQAVPHIKVDVQELDVDFYAFSSHKIYGPTGMGVLYGKETLLEQLPPYQGGGEMIASVSIEKTSYNELPFKFEAGTPDFIGSTAFAEALRYVNSIGHERIAAHEAELLRYATGQLLALGGVRIIGESKNKAATLSFLLDNIHPYDAGMLLDSYGIAVRTGHHCAQPLMQAFGIDGTIRASFALYNTKDEIDTFIKTLATVKKMLNP